ncbi:hypothetical protein E2C01_088267 [Portunus trituberculatus]|uniref:Uncharacterized protein n=1 Tax=Portunus trituberculatus TaxID=210409 RepID=A0A5B7JEX4_PORTR|nr:hypothetical protein [Portunus trituberculatus]
MCPITEGINYYQVSGVAGANRYSHLPSKNTTTTTTTTTTTATAITTTATTVTTTITASFSV